MCPLENSNSTYEFMDKFIIFPDYNKKFKSKSLGKVDRILNIVQIAKNL